MQSCARRQFFELGSDVALANGALIPGSTIVNAIAMTTDVEGVSFAILSSALKCSYSVNPPIVISPGIDVLSQDF